jgi:hypothetical protein
MFLRFSDERIHIMGLYNWLRSGKRDASGKQRAPSALSAQVSAIPSASSAPEAEATSAVAQPEVEPPPLPGPIGNIRLKEITIAAAAIAAPDPEDESSALEQAPEIPKISLRVAPILEALPAEIERPALRPFAGTEARIQLPLTMIQSQLASGRVTVRAPDLLASMPEEIRSAFGTVDSNATVPIPLQEIFRELPMDSLRARSDQVIEAKPAAIPTPFAEHAREDEARFATSERAPSENESLSEPVAGKTEQAAEEGDVSDRTAAPDFAKLQALLLTDEDLDVHKVVSLVGELPGVRRSLLTTLQGQAISGDLGAARYTRAATFLIPQLFTTANQTLGEIGFAPLQTMTLHFGNEQLSSFIRGKRCLTILHLPRPLRPGVRETIAQVMAELVREQTAASR